MRAKIIYTSKAIGRRLIWAPSDLMHRVRGDGAQLPPRGLSFVGRSDFRQTGDEFLGHFTELGGLRPDHRVLDAGCGIGRMAIPLADYLEGGSYEGFDVGREMIRWCDRHVTSVHPEFKFTWTPIYNQKYNPFGTLSASEFKFPYPDASFDFALATSLFTHLTREEVRHYLDEVGRVLKPGGTSLLTFFLLTPDSEAEIEAGRAGLDLRHLVDGARTINPRQPEEAIAYPEAEIREMLTAAGLRVREPIHHGQWANTPGGASFQDIVIAERGTE